MFWKKNSKSSGNSTKQPRSASNLRINSLIRGVLVLALVKVVVLGSMFMPGPQQEQAGQEPVFESVTVVAESGRSGPSYVLREEAAPRPDEPQVASVIAEAAPQNVSAPAASQVSESVETVAQGASSIAPTESALSVSRIFGVGVAHAQNLPVPNPSGGGGFLSPTPGGDMPIPSIPAPDVGDFVSRDSAAAKQAELNRREQELMALQQQMESRMSELHTLESRLQGMIDSANTTQESKFNNLVDMYANMKPRVAAEALSNMDETIAVRILTGMKSTESGEVMSYMDPLVAARLSEAMTKMQL